MMDESTETDGFTAPPEAPVFTPTLAEFADPLAYIAKIKPTLDKTGICKIRPPADWQPPFAVDVENFRFVPRVQKINELEATTRVKLIFLNKLLKFWELQGVVLKVPTVGKKPLDFHKLHKVVNEEGGFDTVCNDQRWGYIASERMNLPSIANKDYASILRCHYEKFLYPYDLFDSGVSTDPKVQALLAQKISSEAMARKSPHKKDVDVDYTLNSEMKKLQYFGAGKKVALPSIKQDMIESVKPESSKEARRPLRDRSKASYLESDICRLCSLTDNEDEMLTCSACDEVYHKYCLIPKVTGVIRGDWRCPNCVAKEYKKPTEVFGFEQSNKEYSLAAFGTMADKFKENYFQQPVRDVDCSEVEREFWRLTKCLTEDVTVQYGADIHALTNGSGFPTQPSDDLTEEDERYIYSKWNLNNLPVSSGSVLKYISGDVSGMKVPWCYVGMCFSSFCWHIEDHWSYSINFLHWGEPKTWYGVPSSQAEALEEVMRSRAPELFEQSPDLLHHITTIMNPNSLMSHNISVVRTNQRAGEFIVTAPRAFHAGFNQGYNFAEAVNFCPADWLPMGRQCITQYKKVKRYCVFSHEELICKMAADSDSLDLILAVETHKELLAIVDQERKLRKKLLEHGVKKAEREAFELLPDDERQCNHCKTTCFLSAITCPCKPNKVACIEHITQLCHCPGSRKCLRYRYTLDELPAMIRSLGKRVEGYDLWSHNVRAVFSAKGKDRQSLGALKQLYMEGKENQYPENSLYKSIQRAVKDGERYSALVKEIVNRKARTRRHTDLAIKSAAARSRLTLQELNNLMSQLDSLACTVKDSHQLEDLSERAAKFQENVKNHLSSGTTMTTSTTAPNSVSIPTANSRPNSAPNPTNNSDTMTETNSASTTSNPAASNTGQASKSTCSAQTPASVSMDIDALKKLYDVGFDLDMDIPELQDLQNAITRAQWLSDVHEAIQSSGSEAIQSSTSAGPQANSNPATQSDDEDDVDLVTVEELRVLVRRGQELPLNPAVDEILTDLEHKLKISQSWEEKASICLQAKPRHTLSTIETILSECDHLKVYLPNIEALRDAVQRALEWKTKATDTLNATPQPTLEQLRSLVVRATSIPVKLEQVDEINSIIDQSEEWKSEAYSQFIKPSDTTNSLLDVLLPRHKQTVCKPSRRKKKTVSEGTSGSRSQHSEKLIDSRYSVDGMYEKCSQAELESTRELREYNENRRESQTCECESDPTATMFCCSLCKVWIHYSCSDHSGGEEENADDKQWLSSLSEENRFLCPRCMRSKRPKLDIILRLLMSLQKIPARLLEGEALQSLTERSITWQDKAKEFISSPIYTQLNIKFDTIKAKNKYMKEHKTEEITEKLESHPIDHDYLSSAFTKSLQPKLEPKVVSEMFEISTVEPDKELSARLSDVMLEGHLLEVTVSEMSTLWSFSKILTEYKHNKLQPPVDVKRGGASSHTESTKTSVRKSKHNIKSEFGDQFGPTQEAIISSTTSNHGDYDDNATSNTRESSSTGETISTRKRQRRPRSAQGQQSADRPASAEPGAVKVKRRRKKKIIIEISDGDDEEDGGDDWGDYDEKCAAVDGCQLPDDESIGWVQCERCHLWYHFVCIGVSPEKLADADYYCYACEDKSNTAQYEGEEEPLSDSDELTQTITAEDVIRDDYIPVTVIIEELNADTMTSSSAPNVNYYQSGQSDASSQLSSASTKRFKPLNTLEKP